MLYFKVGPCRQGFPSLLGRVDRQEEAGEDPCTRELVDPQDDRLNDPGPGIGGAVKPRVAVAGD